MSTVNIGAALPTGSNIIGQVKLVDTGGTNQAAIDANNNLHVALYNAANSMGIDSSNNAHVGVWNGSNQMGVNSGGNAAMNLAQVGGNAVTTGTGASGSGIARVTVSNDSQLQVWDGTTGPVAVKAASTAPVLADKAMVHVLSPNNTGLPVNLASIVQSTSNKSSGSVASLAKAFGSNNTAGNSIVVVCAVGNGTAPTISDTASNTYTQIAQIANGTALNTAIFLGLGSTAGSGIAAGANTVTVNNGGTTASIAMEIYELPGLLTFSNATAQPDQSSTNTGTSGTASTASISAQSPNEWAFAAVGVGTAAQTITPSTGWTNDSGQQNPTTPAGLFSFISMSQFLGSLKAVTPQATFTSEPWAMAVATFRPVLLGVEGTVKLTDGTVTMGFGSKTSANSLPVVIASDQAGPLPVAGMVASGASNANNPVKIGGVFNTTQPTVTNGQVVDLQATARGALIIASGADGITVQPGNTANTTAWLTQPVAGTSGGSTPYHLISAASTNATNVKNSAGLLYGFEFSNTSASARYIRFYDSSSAPTVGTTTIKKTIQVPGNATVIRAYPIGLAFTSGIGFSTTTAMGDSDTTAVGAGDLSIDLDYK